MMLRLFFLIILVIGVLGIGGLALVHALDLGAGYRFGVILLTGGAGWFVFKLFSQWHGD